METQTMKFSEAADLSKEILKAVEKMGFTEMTPIQMKTLPLMMEGRDIIALAPTGTGKTCAFGIPMLEYVNLQDKRVQELVLAPTRELSLQITEELKQLSRFIPGVRIACLYGGQPIAKQLNQLKQNPQIVVATPGRLLDHLNRGNTAGLAIAVIGQDARDIMEKLRGIPCRGATSCPDQLSRAIEQYLNEQAK